MTDQDTRDRLYKIVHEAIFEADSQATAEHPQGLGLPVGRMAEMAVDALLDSGDVVRSTELTAAIRRERRKCSTYRKALDDARYMIGDGNYWSAKKRIDRALDGEVEA